MNPADLVPALALLAVATRELLWLTAAAITLSNIDDLAMDMCWMFGVAFRRHPALPPKPETAGHFAIFVPAWDEVDVIADMLARLVASLDHPAYTVFVGTYANDPATRAAALTVRDPRIIVVTVPVAGPTTKADCLNHLWRAMRAHEAETQCAFKAVVLHDAEDTLHPAELSLYDRYMPALAMVQIPVIPLSDPRSPWISGHYIDEFAQNHAKDMMVRAWLDTPVPSAGVGTAIDREALARLAGSGGTPFDASSLTEDYEIGHRLHQLGLKGRMVRHRLGGALVGTRAFFPATLDTAVRQKSRWLTGIALTGWDRLGWSGRAADRWMLLRDRKGLFTAGVAIIAYAAAALVVAQLAVRALVGELPGAMAPLPPLIGGPDSRLLPVLLLCNAVLLVWRLAGRSYFTWRDHGRAEGLRAIPRAVVGNIVNALAAWRAIQRYRGMLIAGIPLKWDKTAHHFPTAGPAPSAGPATDPAGGLARG